MAASDGGATDAYYEREDVRRSYRGRDSLEPSERVLVDAYLADAATLLDLCCGTGRVAIALAGEGHVVTGVDRSPGMLGEAREAAAAAEVQVTLVEADARSLPLPDAAFDGAIVPGNSIGHLDTEGKAACLAELARVLRPGAPLVLSIRTGYALNRFLPGQLARSSRHLLDRLRRRAGAPPDAFVASHGFVHRPSVHSVAELVRRSGFAAVAVASPRTLAGGRIATLPDRYLGGQFFVVGRKPPAAQPPRTRSLAEIARAG